MNAATHRAMRMKKLFTLNRFLEDPLERGVYNNFKKYMLRKNLDKFKYEFAKELNYSAYQKQKETSDG